jgi:two-component system, chemotaxis family, CheB/CheR fusion protein
MTPGQRTQDHPAIRVLIVDDNSDAAQTTGMWLELSGCKVDVLTDGTKCLPHLVSFNPDVLLLDIGMPDISGYELADQIKSRPEFETLPIIAISGYADAEHMQRSIAYGCSRHLIKPVDLQVLNDIIIQEIQNRKQLQGGKGA